MLLVSTTRIIPGRAVPSFLAWTLFRCQSAQEIVRYHSLVGTKNEFGRYYEECRGRGMRHNKALKAVARKRLKVIYAIMRDRVPYRAA